MCCALQIAGSQLFRTDYYANSTISTEYDNACIINTRNNFLAHVCTCMDRLTCG